MSNPVAETVEQLSVSQLSLYKWINAVKSCPIIKQLLTDYKLKSERLAYTDTQVLYLGTGLVIDFHSGFLQEVCLYG